jgi:hypothetical protein
MLYENRIKIYSYSIIDDYGLDYKESNYSCIPIIP